MAVDVTDLIDFAWAPLHATSEADAVWVSDALLTRLFNDEGRNHAKNHAVFVVRDNLGINLISTVRAYNAPSHHISTISVSLNNVPLIASSSTELSMRDDDYLTTAGTPTHWYEDRDGVNRIALWPVPSDGDDGDNLDVVYHRYYCDLDEAHVNTDILVPSIIGDYLLVRVLGEVHGMESDGRIVESSKSCKELANLISQSANHYWGKSQ